MATKENYTFSSATGIEDLVWMNPPTKFSCGASGESGLEVFNDKETDFWQKTYYNPPLMNDNGHLLYKMMGSNMMMETKFHVISENQFDQAGLMVYKDKDTWIKTGLETVDGEHRLSVVVTNGYSDWSTQVHGSGDLSLRLYRFGPDFVIEAKSESFGDWNFIRICHLNINGDELIKAGVLSCAPIKDGGKTIFDYLSYSPCKEYHHKAQ